MAEREEGQYWYDPDNKELVIEIDEEESRFYFQDKFEIEGENYCLLTPSEDFEDKEDEDKEEDALIMKVVEEDGEELLKIIEDDEEFEEVCRYYYEQEN